MMALIAEWPLMVALACLVVSSLLFAFRPRKARRLPPGKLEWPVGNLQIFTEGFKKLFDYDGEAPRKHRVLWSNVVTLTHPDHVKQAFHSDTDTIDSGWGHSTRTLLGELSVNIAGGAYHRMLRRVLGQFFTWQAVESYLPGIQEISERYCAAWAEASAEAQDDGSSGNSGCAPASSQQEGSGQPATRLHIDKLPKMQSEIRRLTFEVISHVVAGFRFTEPQLDAMCAAFDDYMAGLFAPIAIAFPGSGYARALKARKVILKAYNEQIDRFKADAASEAKGAADASANGAADDGAGRSWDRGSLAELMVRHRKEDGQEFTRKELEDIGMGMLFAGHETSAITILKLLLRLRSNPEIVERLRAEQREAVEKHGDKVTGAALRDMPYLDAVVKESFRVDPVVPFIPRKAVRDVQIGGYDIPKGWGLFLAISATSRFAPSMRDVPEGDPFDPRVFNPDRWVVAGGSEECTLHPGQLASAINMLPPQLMTFGSGVRYCLGGNLVWMEVKAFFCVLLRRYDFVAPLEHMDVKTFPTINITADFPLQVRPLPTDTVAAA